MEYLEDDFDAKRITINQLCSILSKHNVELPASKQRKDVYVDLFEREIYMKREDIRANLENIKPSSQGIEIVKASGSSKIPVLKGASSPRKLAVEDYEQDAGGEVKDEESFVVEAVAKPSLLTVVKIKSSKRKSLDAKDRDVKVLEEEDDADQEGKRFKKADPFPQIVESNEETWSPRLAWKLGKPPTPMLMKAKILRHLTVESVVKEQIIAEAPKQTRFNIQPQLPGVRDKLPPFSPQKVEEHLKPVKDLIAKFDDGMPVGPPGHSFPSIYQQKDEGRDSDSTLSIEQGEYDDSFLIDKDVDLKFKVDQTVESLFEKDSILGADVLELEEEVKPSETRKSLLGLFQTFVFYFSLAVLMAICINEMAKASAAGNITSLQAKVNAALSFAYQHPAVAFDLFKSYTQSQFAKIVTQIQAIDLKDVMDQVATEAVRIYQVVFLPAAQQSFQSFKSLDFQQVKDGLADKIKLADMHMQDFGEYCLENTLSIIEQAGAGITQYSLLFKYELAKITLWMRQSELVQSTYFGGKHMANAASELTDAFVVFSSAQFKRLLSEDSWKYVSGVLVDLVQEYPAPFGLDNQSFIALLVASGLTFGAIGAFLLLI